MFPFDDFIMCHVSITRDVSATGWRIHNHDDVMVWGCFPIFGHLSGEPTVDRWINLSKGQYMEILSMSLCHDEQAYFHVMLVRYILSSVCLRIVQFSQSSFTQYMGAVCFQLLIPLVVIVRICATCYVIFSSSSNRKYESLAIFQG